MDYTLAVLTHGRAPHLHQTIHSFLDKVKPRPARILVYSDGLPVTHVSALPPHELHVSDAQRGFCAATRRLWHIASSPDPDEDTPPFTFWLEHDFVFLRRVDLAELAAVLDDDTQLAQMALMRTPVNRQEIAAGGLYESRPDDFTPRVWEPLTAEYDPEKNRNWLEQRAYFTTNPSLMRTAFMTWNQWPDDDAGECEGRFGLDLVRRGFYFGVWGVGDPWVEHLGRRDGSGRGY